MGFVAIVHTYLELTGDAKTSDKGLEVLESLGYRCSFKPWSHMRLFKESVQRE